MHCSGYASERQIRMGADSVNEDTVQRWLQKFFRGEFDLKDEDDCGRPSVVVDFELKSPVKENTRAKFENDSNNSN